MDVRCIEEVLFPLFRVFLANRDRVTVDEEATLLLILITIVFYTRWNGKEHTPYSTCVYCSCVLLQKYYYVPDSGDVEMYQVIVGNYDERQKVSQLWYQL